MAMTRKHFEAIASAIKETKDRTEKNSSDLFSYTAAHNALNRATYELAEQLRLFNPNFDTAKFYRACGF